MSNLEEIRHSCAHLLAAAVMKLWPDTKRTIGPPTEEGFYYDFDFTHPLTEEDLPKIEKKMREILPTWKNFERTEVTKEQAKKEFVDNPYKLELIDEFSSQGQKLTLYKSGDYVDLCRGGHVNNPKEELKNFKLLKLAGAYWRGDSKNKMLTRIYATAFPTKTELEEHLNQIEEAKKRDHKVLGEQLELYMIHELVGKGLPIWLPKGDIIKREIEKFAIETEEKYGYVRVSTPHLAKEELFMKSGHLPHYEKTMYPKMVMDDGTYYLKAMNCPIHHLIYNKGIRSYRELPLRIAEYGTVYRNELSGTLAGLLRVRMLSMNDAHIYCTKDQIESEIESLITMVSDYFKIFGLKDYHFRLSLWDPSNKEKYIDEPDNWKHAEEALRKILKKLNINFVEAKDEAAFYGPKIDIQYKVVTGREETMSTIQLDFAAKKRFELRYIDKNNTFNNEVFVIHRAPLSTHERFVAFLIEHYAGKFPLWLSPVQVAIMPVTDRHNEYAKELYDELVKNKIRVELDDRSESIGKKVRDSVGKKINYLITVGDREVESGKLAVRTRDNKIIEIGRREFIDKILEEIKNKNA